VPQTADELQPANVHMPFIHATGVIVRLLLVVLFLS
jgi:hypothetical protein